MTSAITFSRKMTLVNASTLLSIDKISYSWFSHPILIPNWLFPLSIFKDNVIAIR